MICQDRCAHKMVLVELVLDKGIPNEALKGNY